MTRNRTGIEPPLPSGNCSFPLPITRIASHDLRQTPRSWPRQTFNPASNAAVSSQDLSEPAFKRQKIGDPATSSIGKTSEALRGVADLSNTTSNKAAFIKNGANFIPEREGAEEEQQSSLFPIRPRKIPRAGGIQQGRALAIARATARDPVAVKPYVPEPPPFAPRFYKAGKCPSLCTKACILNQKP